MTPVWDDLTARSRGLGTHLLSRGQLESLAHLPDLGALAGALRRHGVLVTAESEVPSYQALELAVRRWAASLLGVLARWAGPRADALPLVFDDEDRRSLRALTRGAVQHAPADERLAGLVPTPALPDRALRALAALPSIAQIAGLLSAWRHPFAPALAPFTQAVDADLFAVDVALDRAAAARATRAARRSHDRELRRLVAGQIDLRNVVTALILAGLDGDTDADDVFVPGGSRLGADAFRRAAGARDATIAANLLAPAFATTPWAAVIRRGGGNVAATERELRRRQLAALAAIVRRQPLGPVPVIWFALRLRAQVGDLHRIIWALALGVPHQTVADTLATAAS